MKRKNLLIITSKPIFPVDGGDKLRILEIARELGKYYDIDIIFPGNKIDKNLIIRSNIFQNVYAQRVNFLRIAFNIFKFILNGLPIQLSLVYHPSIKKFLENHGDKYDIILPHLYRSAFYIPNKLNSKVVYEACDCFSLAAERIKSIKSIKEFVFKIDQSKVYKLEKRLIRTFPKAVFINDEDLKYLVKKKNSIKLKVITNGKRIETISNNNIVKNFKSKTFLFIGNMNTIPNQVAINYFCNEIFDKYFPDYQLIIAGKNSKSFNRKRTICVDHFDSLQSLSKIGIFAGIAPMQNGVGVQNKILDYFNMKIPSLTTNFGYSGLTAIPDEQILIFRDSLEFKNKINLLSENNEYYKSVAIGGFEYLKEYHNWTQVGESFKNLIEDNR
jgi:glycosyltransferase involved in cell wall biosynthesis